MNTCKAEESFYAQKSRIRWLKEGDANTPFFHNSVKSRFNRNKLVSLTKEDGSIVYESAEIKEEAISFFRGVLNGTHSYPYPGRAYMEQFMNKGISRSQSDFLDAPVTSEEVKAAFFNIPPLKAPGPDGFNVFFFRKAWHILGEDLIQAVQSFFISGHMLREINHASITLVPKVPNPSKLSDYMPISCCKTIYKCISKILANRLKTVLPTLIDGAQSAFIPGRSITDNILLVQELLRNYHRKDTSARCAIKVDLCRAFDTVRWEFF